MKKIFFLTALLSAPLAPTAPARAQLAVENPMPDVSRLEYRSVTLLPLKSRLFVARNLDTASAHLWIVPTKEGEPPVGIGWDGVPYEVRSVGEKADWRADVEAHLKPLAPGVRSAWPAPYAFANRPVALLFLEQLGAPDLKRAASADPDWTSTGTNPELARLQNLRDAGVRSFAGEQWGQARLQLQELIEVWPAKARVGLNDVRPEARQILEDIERRARDTARPTDEIAGLIWDLQNVRAYQMSVPGDIGWTRDPTVQKLIGAGDAAVPPLLQTLETDDRLTLSVRVGRSRPGPGSIGTVRDAAQSALQALLKHQYYTDNYQLTPAQRNAEIVAQMRADWDKIKGQSPQDRIFSGLAPGQDPRRLLESARELVRTGPEFTFTRQADGGLLMHGIGPDAPFRGEPLRARQNPSVSDLLEARIIELSRRALSVKSGGQSLDPGAPDYVGGSDPYAFNTAMAGANELATIYAKWDPKRALPLLGEQLERTKTYLAKAPRGTGDAAQRTLQDARRRFLVARVGSPFGAEAMGEYGEFLASQPFGRVAAEDYAPLWLFPNEPAMTKAAHALFDAPRRPWQEAATWETSGFGHDSAFRLLHSPLVQNPIARAAILRELENQTVIGTLRATQNGEAEIKVTAWNRSGQTVKIGDRPLENGASQALRVCDLVGFWLLQPLPDENGQSRRGPTLDVALPTAERDARLRQIAVLVMQGKVVAESFGIVDAQWNGLG